MSGSARERKPGVWELRASGGTGPDGRRVQVSRTIRTTSRRAVDRALRELVAEVENARTRLGGDLGLAPRTLADKLSGASYAELEQVAVDIRRRYVLALPDGDLARIARTRIEQWRTQAHP